MRCESTGIVRNTLRGRLAKASEGGVVEAISTFDIFKIGVGPSSSHTMGPWRAAQRFLASCTDLGVFDAIARAHVDLFGSLAKTGKGHGTDLAVTLGLSGVDPVTCDPSLLHRQVDAVRAAKSLLLGGQKPISFDPDRDITFHYETVLPFHPNGLTFTATLQDGSTHSETFYSIGGGFVVKEGEKPDAARSVSLPMPIATAAELLKHCREHGLSIPEVVRRNELAWRDAESIRAGLRRLWETMKACVEPRLPNGGRLAGCPRRDPTRRGFESQPAWRPAVRRS